MGCPSRITPTTTALLLRASSTFDGEAFTGERRLRERLQALAEAGLVRAWPAATGNGGLMNYHKLTLLSFEVACGTDVEQKSEVPCQNPVSLPDG
jgi:hypothetical protein